MLSRLTLQTVAELQVELRDSALYPQLTARFTTARNCKQAYDDVEEIASMKTTGRVGGWKSPAWTI